MKLMKNGSITSPLGYTVGIATCGLKVSAQPDLMLLHSTHDCTAAALFTRNQVVGAPITLDRETLANNNKTVRAVAINSGIANVCTGALGLQNARNMQSMTATALHCQPDQVLVLSTGLIGVQLPMEKLSAGIRTAAAKPQSNEGPAAARAIMTTDTLPKHLAIRIHTPKGKVTIGAIVKGSGMIHPNMATMLALITTDAKIPATNLRSLLKPAVDASFNRISIDGDTSTSDAVLLLANGTSGISCARGESRQSFEEALNHLVTQLAKQVVKDGEGVSKLVSIRVSGARKRVDAHRVANTIATSPLVKTMLAGSDPNWGRVMAAAGRSGVHFDPLHTKLWIGTDQRKYLQLVEHGAACDYNEPDAVRILSSTDFEIHLDLGCGQKETTVWTGDLTREYVSINTDYRT